VAHGPSLRASKPEEDVLLPQNAHAGRLTKSSRFSHGQ